MSTATPVPETWELTGDDARDTLRSCGRWTLVRDAFVRLRVADGFSHARSLAYVTSLTLVQGTIALVGLASALGRGGVSDVIVRTFKAAVPGPGSDVLTDAVDQAHRTGAQNHYFALVFGLIGALISGTTMLGQLERALNRFYGVERDRPTLKKYGLALLLAVTSGVLAVGAFTLLAFGRTIGDSINSDVANRVWAFVRWPIALVLIGIAVTLLFRWSPRRRQPGLSWLAFGATVSVVAWTLCTVALGAFFTASTSFGKTYGPLAGVVALLLWSFFSSVAVLFGGAIAAQLEAVRAGARQPQDPAKVAHSEPDSAPIRASDTSDADADLAATPR